MNDGWIGVDLDGTLAHYDKWVAWDQIGAPIPLMVERIKAWVSQGIEVKIFTARIAFEQDTCKVTGKTFTPTEVKKVIGDWLEANGLPRLDVTARKDFRMIQLWDDRCVQVIPNTGVAIADELLAARTALKGKP